MATNSQSRIKLFGATISPTGTSHSQANADRQDPPGADPTAPKRPDKIIPCPRCKSTDTKFCYFNNYNVNQPRHFCKGCQRYWTAGGALRNVPVGAGRRKNKPSGPELPEVCLFDAAASDQVEFDSAVAVADMEEWRVAEHGGIRHIFPGKRRRFASNSQTC